MSESYQIVPPPGSSAPLDPKRIADLLAKDGQLILPLLDLLENAQCALDEVIDVMGRATIEAVLRMSAEAIAGPRQQGKKSDRDIVYHGTQKGRVALKERELVVDKPRLRRRHPQAGESAEVEIPAYEAMRGKAGSPSACSRSSSRASRPDATSRSSPRWPGRWASPRARSGAKTSRRANGCWTTSPAAISPGSNSWPSGSMGSSSAPTT